MTSRRIPAFVAALAIAAAVSLTAQTQTPQTQTNAQVFSLIGCVERVMPTPVAAGSKPAAPAPAYKLIDVQPGTVGEKPITLGREFRLTGASIKEIAKHQNQWVEVTGTLEPPAPPTPVTSQSSTTSGQQPTAPLPGFRVTAIKVVNTECKG